MVDGGREVERTESLFRATQKLVLSIRIFLKNQVLEVAVIVITI